ncbi:hypothetical protein [Anaerotruncus colihominis]|uniref:Uncharacterized protein n=1 Tax=Anaerotruncus colihominis TaxID=169435 RepID=A0A1Y4MPS4_9FIRM|nr:hypothetical protein [Anaerotruncus colihominis]OUP70159.1 hypothetical protein B5F11_05845 [Anaerotruncus colihominis]OUP74697.1 hypothetical protein B5F10_06720 [Anaerotruncus colihominis]
MNQRASPANNQSQRTQQERTPPIQTSEPIQSRSFQAAAILRTAEGVRGAGRQTLRQLCAAIGNSRMLRLINAAPDRPPDPVCARTPPGLCGTAQALPENRISPDEAPHMASVRFDGMELTMLTPAPAPWAAKGGGDGYAGIPAGAGGL